MKILLATRKIIGLKNISYLLLKLIGIEIPKAVKLGKNVTFVHWAYGTVIHPNTEIEDNVKIYQGVTIGRADIFNSFEQSEMKGILIKKGAILCAGSKVLCKKDILTVGENTVIGANSVLLDSTGNNEIWCGMPASKIKNRH